MKTVIHIIVFILLLIFSAGYCVHYFGGYEGSGDGNDYAALARNIISGKGFVIEHIYPLGLTFNPQIPQPNNIWAPGYPLYLSFWFAILGVGDNSAIWASIMAHWLLIVSGYLLAKKIGGETIALLTAALIGLSQVTLYTAVEGTPEILSGALITFSIWLLLSSQSHSRLILSGILFGVAVLTRYQIAVIGIPIVVLFLENYRRNLLLWLTAFLFMLIPWLIRNWIILGNPFFTLQSYGEFAKGMRRFSDFYFVYRSFTPMPLWYLIAHFPLDLARKFLSGFLFFATTFPLRFNYLGIVPFFFGLYKINQFQGLQKKCLLLAFIGAILIIILSSLDGHHDRHLITMQPFFAVATVLGGVIFARVMGFYRYKIVVVFAAALLFFPSRFPYQEYGLKLIAAKSQADRQAFKEIARITGPEEVVVADASDAVWWYAKRKSIWLPVNYDDFKLLMERPDCHYVYFSDPVTYMNNRTDPELADFGISFRRVEGFNGPGWLYILYKEPPVSSM